MAAIGAILAALATIWLPPIPPCQDAPGHITAVRVLLNPEAFAEWLAVAWAPTAQAFHAVAFAFGQVLGVFAATKATLTLYLALQVWAFRRFAAVVGGQRDLATVGACLGFVGWGYAMGFFNYLGAFSIGAVALALWVDKARPPLASAVAAVAFAAAGWAHVVVGAMVLTHAVALDVVGRRWREAGWRDVLVLTPAILLAAATVGVVLREHQDIGAVEATAAVYASLPQTIVNWLGTGIVGYSRLGFLVAPLAFALVVGLGVIESGASSDMAAVRRASAIGAVVWSVVFFALPFHGVGWHFASPRVLFFVFALPLAAVAWPTQHHRRGLALAGLALLATASLVDGAPRAWAEGDRIARSVARFGEESVGRAYIVTYAPEAVDGAAPHARPNIGTGRYAIWHGGADPGQFAFNRMRDSVVFARPMLELFPSTRSLFTVVDERCLVDAACAAPDADRARADRVAASAMRWDSVVLVETPPAFDERLLARGLTPSAPGVYRPDPATVSVRVTLPSVPPPGPVVFRAGYRDTIGFFRGGTIPASRFSERQPELRFDALPGGPTWLEVFVDLDGDGALSPADIVLMNAPVTVTPGAAATIDAT